MPLFVVATPIGNLADMTYRAVDTLKNADLIAAEDTRTSRILLDRYEIKTPVTSFHAHSPESQADKLLAEIRAGKSVALISDAGTPGISDPGFRLISRAAAEGLPIIPIPGCCAAITALAASGLPADKFGYVGFLPLKKGRKTAMQKLEAEDRTMILYESVHRIQKTLAELAEICGPERVVVVARELTKLHEELWRGRLADAVVWSNSKSMKGEFVLLLAPADFQLGGRQARATDE